MKTTLKEIWKHYPCGKNPGSDHGWDKLTKNLGTKDLTTEVTLMQILESNGIRDAIWALRCFEYINYCLFLADVAASVLHLFEKNTGYKDNSVRRCIHAIHLFQSGMITVEELKELARPANGPAEAAYDTDAAFAAYAAADAAYDAADADAADAATGKWQEIEALFIKHFGEK